MALSPDLSRFFTGQDTLALREPLPIAGLRRNGREQFTAGGLPGRRSEAWRFSNLTRLLDTVFTPADEGIPAGLADYLAAHPTEADRLVFANGRFLAAQSQLGLLPDGVVLGSLAAVALERPAEIAASFDVSGGAERAFLSLNAALFTDGPVLIIPDGVALTRPVQILYWAETGAAAAHHLKTLLRIGAGAAADVTEIYAGIGGGWTNVSATITLGAKARLGHYTLQNQAIEAFHTGHLALNLAESARYDGFLLTLGASVARQDVRAVLAGARAYCGYSGAYLLQGRQESSVVTVIEHAAPGCETREVFKGCLSDRAHGVFQGLIRVLPAGQQTNAYQLNKTLLLGDRAVIDTKPELEIHADDVKCSHGATVGDLDETALFYLCSRGIPPELARPMLINAFVQDAIEQIENDGARALLGDAISQRLTGSL